MIKDKVFFELLKQMVFEIYPIAKQKLEDKIYFRPKYDEYPRLKYKDNGMPWLDKFGEAPLDITSAFKSYSDKPDIVIEEYSTFNNCFNYIRSNDYFKAIILFYDIYSDDMDHLAKYFLIRIIERYHLMSNDKLDEDVLLNIYAPLEALANKKELYIDIAIPIINITPTSPF